MSVTRVRGDSYPIDATLKINGVPINLTGSTVRFSYKSRSKLNTVTLNGEISEDIIGKVSFIPGESDFSISGIYDFDIERDYNGIKTTHLVGTLVLTNDITK